MAPAQIAAPADTAAPPPRKKSGILRILALGLGAVAMAAAGFGAGWFYFSQASSPMSEALRLIEREDPNAPKAADPNAPQKTPRPMPDSTSFVTSYHPLPEPLTTNPANSRRFLQVGITLSTQYDAKVIANVTTHEAALRSDMLAVIGSFSEDQINGIDGREALAMALRDAINARLISLEGFGGIEGVFFTSFVLQ
jgi:flagellar FliL protein